MPQTAAVAEHMERLFKKIIDELEVEIARADRLGLALTSDYLGGCGSGVEPASCYRKVAGCARLVQETEPQTCS